MIVMVVVEVVLLLLLLLLQVVAVVVMVEMVVIRLDRVPGAHDLRLGSVRQDVQYAERLNPALVRVPIPLVLLVRVLHLHHLQTFQRLEVIVRGTCPRRTVTASPTVHFLLVVLLLLFLVPQRGHGITAATLVDPEPSPVRHPVIAAARVTILVVDHRFPGITSSRAQSVHVFLPRLGQPFLLLRGGRDHDQGQRAGAANGDLVLVVLHVAPAGGASARRPSVDRRSQAAGRRGARGHRRRR